MRSATLSIALILILHPSALLEPDSALQSRLLFGTGPLFSSPVSSRPPNDYFDYLEYRLQEDLSALFETTQEIIRETQLNRTADYKHVSRTANKIRKLASRIRAALTLGNQALEDKHLRGATPRPSNSELLENQVANLGQLVHKIQSNSVPRRKYVIDARVQCALYGQLEALEALALQVKLQADELMRHGE
jgi:hypothetical protein